MADAPHGAAAHGAPPAGAEGHDAGFPPLDTSLFGHQLFWLVVSFVALYWALSQFVLPKIARVLEQRRTTIEADLAAASLANDTAKAELAAYDRSLAAARDESRRLLDGARHEAAQAQAAEVAEAEQRLTARIDAAEQRLAAGRAEALAAAREAAQDVAQAIVAKLVPFTAADPRRAAGGAS